MNDLQVEFIKLSLLIPYTNNSRIHDDEQIKKVANSIKEFGFINPVLIDEQNIIIAGHCRVLAAKLLSLGQVPCIRLKHLSDAQKKAYLIADNRLALDASWNFELLKLELDKLKELDYDFSVTGFDSKEYEKLFKEELPVVDDNYDINIPKNPKSKLGNIYKLGNHRLMCGDSTNLDHVKELMLNEKVDMVFTDPPWNVNYGAITEDNQQGYKPRTILNDFMGTADFKDFMFNSFKNMNFASKEGAMTYVVMSAQEWGNMMLTLSMNDYHWSSTIIWNKDHLVLSRKDYHTKYEPIWYGWKNGSNRLHPLEDRKQSDVWDFARPIRSEEHPTMKPIELVARAISNSSNSNGLVLDLFGGSGSTLVACEQLNRQCYMMELDPGYVDVIIDRWETFTGKKAILINGQQ